MVILKKLLTLFIFVGFALTPTSYAMKSVDTEGKWEVFDPELIERFPPSRKFFFKENFESKEIEILSKKGNILQKKFGYLNILKYQFSSDENFFGVILHNNPSKKCEIYSTKSHPWKLIQRFNGGNNVKFSKPPFNQKKFVGILHTNNKLDIFELKTDGLSKKKCTFENVSKYTFLPKSPLMSILYNDIIMKKEFWNTCAWKKEMLDPTIKFSPDGVLCAKTNKNNQLIVFEKKHGITITSFDDISLYMGFASGFSFSSQGTFLGFISGNNLIIWNTKTKKISGIVENVFSFKFSHFNNFMITVTTFIVPMKMKATTFKYEPIKNINPFSTPKNTIKNFFGGKPPVKYSDINVLCKKEKL